MAGAGPTAGIRVVCPFCVGCDLTVDRTSAGLRVLEGCAEARELIAREPVADEPGVDGSPATLAAALARAGEILSSARMPLVAGLGTDVAGVRAAMALADRCGGVVDHMGSTGLLRTVRVLQDTGAFTTTLAEVRARADLFLLVGPDRSADLPPLVERVLAGPAAITGAERRLLRLGPPGGDGPFAVTACAVEEVPARVATLRALARGVPLPAAAPGLAEIADALRGGSYAVVSWAAGWFQDPWGEPVVEALVGLVRDLNESGERRAAGLPLAGGDGLVGANQVCAWQAGWPLRTAFTADGPAHDPRLLSADHLLASGEADALVWVSAIHETPPPATDVPVIALVAAGTPAPAQAAVRIPVGVPGLDHVGQTFRMDGVVALPLTALRESPHPTVAQALTAIQAALA